MHTPDPTPAAQRAHGHKLDEKPDDKPDEKGDEKAEVAIEEESVAGEEDPGASLDLPPDSTPGDEHAAVQPPRRSGGQPSAVD